MYGNDRSMPKFKKTPLISCRDNDDDDESGLNNNPQLLELETFKTDEYIPMSRSMYEGIISGDVSVEIVASLPDHLKNRAREEGKLIAHGYIKLEAYIRDQTDKDNGSVDEYDDGNNEDLADYTNGNAKDDDINSIDIQQERNRREYDYDNDQRMQFHDRRSSHKDDNYNNTFSPRREPYMTRGTYRGRGGWTGRGRGGFYRGNSYRGGGFSGRSRGYRGRGRGRGGGYYRGRSFNYRSEHTESRSSSSPTLQEPSTLYNGRDIVHGDMNRKNEYDNEGNYGRWKRHSYDSRDDGHNYPSNRSENYDSRFPASPPPKNKKARTTEYKVHDHRDNDTYTEPLDKERHTKRFSYDRYEQKKNNHHHKYHGYNDDSGQQETTPIRDYHHEESSIAPLAFPQEGDGKFLL